MLQKSSLLLYKNDAYLRAFKTGFDYVGMDFVHPFGDTIFSS